jgi:hypothetical protein
MLTKYQISWKPLQQTSRCYVQANRQADMTVVICALQLFLANVIKPGPFWILPLNEAAHCGVLSNVSYLIWLFQHLSATVEIYYEEEPHLDLALLRIAVVGGDCGMRFWNDHTTQRDRHTIVKHFLSSDETRSELTLKRGARFPLFTFPDKFTDRRVVN